MLSEWIRHSPFVHVFTNSFLLGNHVSRRGNRITGRHAGLWNGTRVELRGGGNRVTFGAGCRLDKSRIFIGGHNNEITIAAGAKVMGCLLWIHGDGCRIIVGPDNILYRCELGCEHTGSRILLSQEVLMGGFIQLGRRKNLPRRVRVYAGEGTAVVLKAGCVVSDGVTMRTSDSHPLYQGGRRINPARDIRLGTRVWIGSGASLLKGAALGEGCVLGYKSLLTKDESGRRRALLAGSPARVLREEVDWDLTLPPEDV